MSKGISHLLYKKEIAEVETQALGRISEPSKAIETQVSSVSSLEKGSVSVPNHACSLALHGCREYPPINAYPIPFYICSKVPRNQGT